jgi:hypothetical protein
MLLYFLDVGCTIPVWLRPEPVPVRQAAQADELVSSWWSDEVPVPLSILEEKLNSWSLKKE